MSLYVYKFAKVIEKYITWLFSYKNIINDCIYIYIYNV